MNFSTIATTWALLGPTARVVIATEPERIKLAERIRADNLPYVASIEVVDLSTGSGYEQKLAELTKDDLLLVLLTVDGFMNRGYRDQFPPFSKPDGFVGKYIFIRLDIPEASLLTGLNTDIGKVEAIIQKYRALGSGKWVHVTAESGTDITMQVNSQELLPYHAREPGGSAFLPPAEISEELVHATANGRITADITVGELRFGAELIDPLGIVDSKVSITVENGLVTGITGGAVAARLKEGLDRLDKNLQVLVELGHGLSDLAPTGIIGVDESMNGTCHFGIGARDPYHVDVVVANPQITVLTEAPRQEPV